jgi:hypothetical protein
VTGGLILASILLALDVAAPYAGIRHGLGGISPARAAVPAVPGECVAGWRQMPVPDSAFDSFPFEVITHRGKPAWIIGGATGEEGLMALRWNGSRWRAVAAGAKRHQGLAGGDVLGARKLLAVGFLRHSLAMTPISGQFIGTRWAARRVPNVPGRHTTLLDVATLPGGRAWAVGTQLSRGRTRAHAVRWTGHTWRLDAPPAGAGSGLTAVERASDGTIWAAGWKESSPGSPRPFIARRKGGEWVPTPSPSLPAGQAVITDVRFRTARDGWAAGYLIARGSDRPSVFLLHWNGRAWSRTALPLDFGALPMALSVSADGDLWIAGTQTATREREERGFIARRIGGDWRIDVLNVPATLRSQVSGVAATGSGTVAVATVGGSLLILHTCGAGIDRASLRQRARIEVSDLRQRRRLPQEEDRVGEVGAAERAAASRIAAASNAKPPTAPVKPPGFHVRDMAKPSGLYQRTGTYRGFAADLDGDGRRDLFIGRHGSLPRVAMNRAEGFVDAPASAFSVRDRHGCDSADVDHDGERDILCAIGAWRGKGVKRHELVRSPDEPTGELLRDALGIVDPLGRGRHVTFIRLDDDPYPEVFITNAPDREDGLPSTNRFYRNVAGTFVPAPGVRLDQSHGGECSLATDVDGDGDEDLVYCTASPFRGRPAGLRLMRNQAGRLRDRTAALGLKPIGDRDVAFADVTGDGRRDVIQLSHALLRVSRATGTGYRRLVEIQVRKATAVAAGDVNADGAADIYVAQGGSPNRRDLLLLSRNGGKRFVSIRIPQTREGSADDVIAIDYDENGLTDFVVLNGRSQAGPIQLLASFPE